VTRRRRPAGPVSLLPCAVLLLAAAFLTGAQPAAAVGYRYWSFWQLAHGAWRFARSGPAMTTPDDGDVEGWRFAVSADSADAVRPRGPARFAAICAGTPAARGEKRIALVLDFGTAADSSDGAEPPRERTACARVPRQASAADALAAVATPLRYDSSGLVCAISGYPATGCGEQVTGGGTRPSAAAGPRQDGGTPSAGLFAGLGVIVVIGAGAAWQARRRRR
jgi:hypothetical protein